MADNVTLPGTGSSVAADEIGGNLYQRVKIAVGADGAAADLAPGQAAMAASLPVAIASNQSTVSVTLADRIAGEDIANDWLKIKPAAPPAGLKYDLAQLFASANINATSWNYGVVLNCAGYSQMFGYAQVNTPNGTVYWCYFSIGITSNVSSRYTVHDVTNVADNAISWFDNVDTGGMRAIGEWCQINIYNPDSGAATIVDAALYLLP